jgi:hypothetical protein
VPDEPPKEYVHIVIGGGIVLAAYKSYAADSAEMHKLCITGAIVHSVPLLERVPPEILEDQLTEYESTADDDTPVEQRRDTVEMKPFDLSDLDDQTTPPKK